MHHKILKPFFEELHKRHFFMVTGVPCSMLAGLFSYAEKDFSTEYIMATQEGEAVAISAGAYLAGRKSVVLCQNSGLGNMVNPLTSLSHPFEIPIFFVMSWRGKPESQDEPQHHLMGEITLKTLELLRINVYPFPKKEADIKETLDKISIKIEQRESCCLLVEEEIPKAKDDECSPNLSSYIPSSKRIGSSSSPLMTRWEALERINEFFGEDTIFIATTGKTGRELFEIREADRNFYMVGSMGSASPLGLGVSLYTPKRVVILDGDGALLMRLGSMATIGQYARSNLCHILLNNKTHDSTGGQETLSGSLNFLEIAKACNYKNVFEANSSNLEKALGLVHEKKGSTFLQVNILPGSKNPLKRPSLPLPKVAARFSEHLKSSLT